MNQIFTAGPPGTGPRDGTALWIDRVARRGYAEPAGLAGDSAHEARLREYLTDLLRPYGVTLRAGPFAGQSYGEMAESFLGPAASADGPVDQPGTDTGPVDQSGTDTGPVDLIVLAYAIPDLTPGRATATYLSHLGGGAPLAFAVFDQGCAAPFTALRLIREYAASGGCRRSLLLVVEQAELPYDPGVPVEVPATHSAVALWFDAAPPGPARGGGDAVRVDTVRQYPGVSAGAARHRLLPAAPGELLVVGGPPGFAPDGVGWGEVRVADAGRPCTGVWWELAGLLAGERDRPGPVLLATYDAGTRCLSTCRLAPVSPTTGAAPDTVAAPPPPPRPGIPAAPRRR